MTAPQIHLVAYLKTGPTAMHNGGWRHPAAAIDDIFSPERYEHIAKVLEAAKFDGAFFADLFGVADKYKDSAGEFLRMGGQNSYLDPSVVLPLMARVTKHLGLGVTISTTFYSPFHLARLLGSLDCLSQGRIAWNVVTSTNDLEAQNAGMSQMPPPEERYARAEDTLNACEALWNSWQDDAFLYDKKRGNYIDATKVKSVNYNGPFHSTRGPLPTPRSPQGRPVIMQAGSSPAGRAFAAKWAEVIFVSDHNKESLRSFYADMQTRLAAEGRAPGSCRILAAVTPILGETFEIAEARAEYFNRLSDPDYGLAYASLSVGADLSKHTSIEAIHEARGNQGTRGTTAQLERMAQTEGLSVVEAAKRHLHDRNLIGTPEYVADLLEEMFTTKCCDGFVVMPVAHPISHEEFARMVVPILQERGLFRTEYATTTLRGNLQASS